MTVLRRRAAHPLIGTLTIAVACVATACSPAGTAAPAGSPSASASPAPSLTPVPGGPATPVVGHSITPPTTTDVTGFGPIFDALPSSFPQLAGQEPAETGSGATSGSFAAKTDAASAVRTIQTALSAQGWSVEGGSPLEDGSVVLEATGPQPGCKAEIRFTPSGGTVIMSVLYGASCPYG